MTVPVDFHLVLHEDADESLIDQAALCLAQVYVEEYVKERDEEQEAAKMWDDDAEI